MRTRLLARGVFVLTVLVPLFLAASPLWAVGESPDNPRQLTLGAAPLSLSINSPGAVVWVRLGFTPNLSTTHGVFETTGNRDTYLSFYKDLADARADRHLTEDDDSGEGLNAKLSQALGYAGPLYLKVRLYSSSSTGSFNLSAQGTSVAPESCPSTGPCAMVEASRGEPSALGVLTTMRTVKNHLLDRTAQGREVIELYYEASSQLVGPLLLDSALRRNLYAAALEAQPALAAVAEIALGGHSDLVLTEGMVATGHRVAGLLMPHLSAETAARLDTAYKSLGLEEKVGTSLAALVEASGFLPGSPYPWGLMAGESRPVVPGEVLVKLKDGPALAPSRSGSRVALGRAAVDQALAVYHFETVAPVFSRLNKASSELDRVLKLRLQDASQTAALIRDLEASGDVEFATPNREIRAASNDLYFAHQYPLLNTQHPAADIRATEAWALESGRASVLVAIVDTGIDYFMADFAGKVRTDLDWDFINDDADAWDDQGHGTHVGGIVAAASNNTFSIAGVAPGVSLLPVKVLSAEGSGTEEGVAAGIVWAVDRGAQVINLSLGARGFSNVIEEALIHAHQHGVLVLAAAGNDGTDEIIYPASSQFAVAVGATDDTNQRTSFSDHGQGLDLMAPGNRVLSTVPGGEVCFASGTSMATPHVTGVGALLRSRAPSANLSQLKEALFNHTLDLGPPGYDLGYGWGLVDAVRSLQAFSSPTVPCTPGGDQLCLGQQRFKAEVRWRNAQGATGVGHPTPFGTGDSGLFWFFAADNWEMLVKVINGCGVNGKHWVFAAATTNVEYTLTVTDTQTGAVREYFNPLGRSAPAITDTGAFSFCSSAATTHEAEPLFAAPPPAVAESEPLLFEPVPFPAVADKAVCVGSATALCLLNQRFKAEVVWRTRAGATGSGQVVPFTAERSGLFWFFSSTNWELLVKMVNGCAVNGSYWVFSAATTNVEYTLRITDMSTGAVKEYRNPQGVSAAAVTDTRAFPRCP